MYEICNKIFNKSKNRGIAQKFRGADNFFPTGRGMGSEWGWENFAVQGCAEPLGELENLGGAEIP